MVIMEHVDGQSDPDPEKMSKAAYNQLSRAVDILHQADFVHGDLRGPNFVLTKHGDIKIIDFDWAGRDGEVRYPPHLSKGIDWHPEVKRAGGMIRIRKAHDEYMLKQLLPHSKHLSTIYKVVWLMCFYPEQTSLGRWFSIDLDAN